MSGFGILKVRDREKPEMKLMAGPKDNKGRNNERKTKKYRKEEPFQAANKEIDANTRSMNDCHLKVEYAAHFATFFEGFVSLSRHRGFRDGYRFCPCPNHRMAA